MSPRIAVITPYFREDVVMLRQCHDSVINQEIAADHFMVADGFALPEIDSWQVQHVKLPRAHGDNGNTPRGLGSLLAKVAGYEFVAYLDADNWFHAGHLASLLSMHKQTGSPICSSFRTFHTLSGEHMDIAEPDENALRHVDTSCLLLHRTSFDLISTWLEMPKILSPICDRIFLAAALCKGLQIQSTGLRSVAFRTQYAAHYKMAGLAAPRDCKNEDFGAEAQAFLGTAQGVTVCVKSMGFWPPSYLENLQV